MAWTAPKTWTANATLTAAELNAHLRDNFNELLPGKASRGSEWWSVAGTNKMVGRVFKSTVTGRSEGTSSTSYTDLATDGPEVTLVTGPSAFVFIRCALQNSTANAGINMSYAISGATTSAAADNRSIQLDGILAGEYWRMGAVSYVSLTPGENTFTAKYKVGSGNGIFSARFLAVLAL